MQPAAQSFKHCTIAPDMLLRRKWQGHITCNSGRPFMYSTTNQSRMLYLGRHLMQHNLSSQIHQPVSEEVQASCNAASKALGVTEVFTNL